MEEKKYPGHYYQPLFDLLNQEHGITPLESEMADIIVVVEKMRGTNLKHQTGAVWVKAKDRLPGWKRRVKWRDGNDHSCATNGEISLFEMEKPNLEGWEWYDESPAAAREEDDPQELWDEHSALIGDDIDDLSFWAGREVMRKEDFFKALKQQKENP